MNRPIRLALCAALAALAVGNVAAYPLQTPEEIAADLAKFEAAKAHAGAPEDSVRFLTPIYRYEVIDRQAILVWETRSKAWLVDLEKDAACDDLERGATIAVETMRDSLNTANGYFVGSYGTRCKMEQIREVDVPAMREQLREAGYSGY